MNPSKRQRQSLGPIDLCEEATHLLRASPASTLAAYYTGSLPFALGLLYFLTDMARNPFANSHFGDAALGMAGLFVWMKCWQVVFARRLRAALAGEPAPSWNLRRTGRLLIRQTVLQPSGLFIIPLSLIPILPFAWVFAFYQNLTVLDDGESTHLRPVLNDARRQAELWPRQNFLLLAILLGFGFLVFLNWLTVSLMLPGLLKNLFGLDSVFARTPFALLNTTFFTIVCLLTLLAVDPLVKTIYVLRCFYGQSLQSGEDIKARLKQLRAAAGVVAGLLVVGLFFATPISAAAAELSPPGTAQVAPPAGPPPAGPPTVVPPAELDRAINDVIHQNKYTWRMPRNQLAPAEESTLARLIREALETLRDGIHSALRWFWRLIQKMWPQSGPNISGFSGLGWMTSLRFLLFALVAVIASILAIVLFRMWKNHRRRRSVVHSTPVQPRPDLNDENLTADQLPEDAWTILARELLERGEFRLALRAFYLASLAHLAARNLIHLAKFKSNLEYERELLRRRHSLPALIPVFSENITIFDRIWYGFHQVDASLVRHFAENVAKIKAG